MRLFAYGTLLFPEVLTVLLGRVPERVPAVAPGWRVAALAGRPYPGLVPDEFGQASGLVLGGLSRQESALLDAYENGEYQLSVIMLADGGSCPTYVWRTEALPEDWNPHGFAVEQLAGYVEHCVAWRAGYRPA